MKLGRHDLIKLRLHLAIAAALVALGVALAAFSLITREQAWKQHDEAARLFRQSEARLAHARTEERDVKELAPLFVRLQESGIIGEERRLDWLESLRELHKKRRLPDMHFEFSPRKPLEGVPAAGPYTFQASAMKLRLDLLHEGDLLGLFADMQQSSGALIVPRGCRLSRVPAGQSSQNISARLKAECDADWITVRRQGGGS